jgi:dethiobiotin synthase
VIVAVTGTGTGVGKTHLACALVGGLRDRGVRAVGWKPVESGVVEGATDTDEALLRVASGCDVAPTLRLRAPLSPHLAARREGRVIDARHPRGHARGALRGGRSSSPVVCMLLDDRIGNVVLARADDLQLHTIL